MERRSRASLVALGGFIVVVVIFLGCIEEEPKITKINMGYQPSTHQLAAMVAAEKGWGERPLRTYGIEDVELRLFPSGPPEMTAMIAGDLDIAYVGAAPPIAAMYEGLDAKIVAGVNVAGSAIAVRPELVEAYERDGVGSLKGKTIATYPPGSIQYTILSQWLLDNTIDPAKDVDIKAMAPSDAVSALGAKSVDAVFLPSPHPEIIEAEGTGKIVKWSGEIWPNHACCCLVASEKMIREHPDIVTQLIKTHINATTYINEHPDEAAEIFAKWQGGDVATIKQSIKISDSRWIHDPHLQIESSLTYALDIYKLNRERYEAKGIKPLTEDDIFDTSFYDKITGYK
ncbi:MAG: ABC transporter substrate-binding protein [Methanophagales archaeon ANME-1-THS]|nr:MAG: ABC transporter substrate-binding protein [Methanophagales archaeon ANME-1-THS]